MPGVDVIKEFLVSIGFNIDSNSLNNAKKSMNEAEKNIKSFSNTSNKNLNDAKNSNKGLNDVLNTFFNSINKLVPELKAPFKPLLENFNTVKKVFDDFSKVAEKDMSDSKEVVKTFSEDGGKAITTFAKGSVASIAAVAASVLALIAVGAGLTKFLNDLAKQDLEYSKLARQLWTTKENAKEIDMALKDMGITMKDLWLSSELLDQFNQLRKDSAALKLPADYANNLKVVRSLGFEFQRLRQLGTLAFQWIGNYILKYAAGPIATIQQAMHKFNEWLITNIPAIAKVIGTSLGIVLRLILVIVETLGFAFNLIGKVFGFIIDIFEKLPAPIKSFLKVLTLIGAVIVAGPIAAVAGLLLALDDLFTALRSGKSIIGDFFKGIKDKAQSAIDSIQKKYANMKKSFKDGVKNIGKDWDYYWDKAKGVLLKLEDQAKKTWNKIKEWSKTLWDKAKGSFSWGVKDTPESRAAIKDFSANIASLKRNFQLPSYLVPNTNNTKNSTTNNSNSNTTNNNFTIYGTNANSTANAVSTKINNGKNIRNLQGVY